MKPTAAAAIGLFLLPGVFVASQSSAEQATVETVDTRYWKCRFCPFPEGLKGEVELGLGGVTDDSAKHGEHNGLDDQGLFGLAGADLTWYGEGATRWDLIARDLGLETRSIELSGGRQGHYEAWFGYDELSHNVADSAATPFRGQGNGVQALPQDWVRGATTSGMTRLDDSLRDRDVQTERRRFNLGAALQAASRWTFYGDVQHEDRDGARVTGAAFLTGAAELLAPVEYETSIFTTGLRYQGQGWNLGLEYKGSFFTNQERSLVWDNPFQSIAAGDDQGEQALAPDNRAHQVNLQGIYRISPRAVFSGNLALGRMLQDDGFLPATRNAALAVPALPDGDADAEVNTLNANARLSWTPPVAGLSTQVRYRADIRDNDTPTRTFTQVITDTFVGAEARNEPLSYARHHVAAQARYRLSRRNRLNGGAEFEAYDRHYGSDPSTREYTLWSELRSTLTDSAQLSVKGARSWRNGSNTAPEVINGAPQNPDMTWFDVADRIQNRVRAALSLFPLPWLTATLSAEVRLSDYDDTRIGRTERTQRSAGLDFSAVLAEGLSLYLYYARQFDGFEQRNSQGFAAPLWRAETEDRFNTLGLGGQVTGILEKIDLAADITWSDSSGQTLVNTGTPGTAFPDFDNQRITLSVRGDYRVSEATSLGLNLAYESFFTRQDWHLDGVQPDTAPRLLSFGRDTDDHQVLVASLVGRYRF